MALIRSATRPNGCRKGKNHHECQSLLLAQVVSLDSGRPRCRGAHEPRGLRLSQCAAERGELRGIRHFVSDNDFKGKTVIPFCTSLSSPLGSSASNLEKLSNGGTWGDGHRFGEQPRISEVDAWVDSLDL